jgi:hypothetical protein
MYNTTLLLRICYVAANIQPTGTGDPYNPYQWANWAGPGWYCLVRLLNDEVPDRSPYGLWRRFNTMGIAAALQAGSVPSGSEYYLDTPPGTNYGTFTW